MARLEQIRKEEIDGTILTEHFERLFAPTRM
jgi:hypothetical protein